MPGQMLSPTLHIWGQTDRGRRRQRNDDHIFPVGEWPAPFTVTPEAVAAGGWLLAVADGVASTVAGDRASEAALATLVPAFYERAVAGVEIETCLLAAAREANTAVWALNQRSEPVIETGQPEAATTLVAAVIRDDMLYVAHGGDSRAYLVTPGHVVCLTNDHSVVQELLDAGLISAQEAPLHPDQGALTRALGAGADVSVDLAPPVSLELDDVLVLCSDGLTTLVSELEIADIVSDASPEQAVHRLIALANERGGYDNISVIVASRHTQQSLWRRLFGKLHHTEREEP